MADCKNDWPDVHISRCLSKWGPQVISFSICNLMCTNIFEMGWGDVYTWTNNNNSGLALPNIDLLMIKTWLWVGFWNRVQWAVLVHIQFKVYTSIENVLMILWRKLCVFIILILSFLSSQIIININNLSIQPFLTLHYVHIFISISFL